jgi:CRP-like cAMP-binding protein
LNFEVSTAAGALLAQLRLLADVPLFAGIPEEELREIGKVLRRVELQRGDVLYRQGEEASGMHVITAGAVGVYGRLPAGREVELGALGVGEVVGELALVDSSTRAATVRALEPTSAFFLGRADFLALASRMDPTSVTIKRRLAATICERLRGCCDAMAVSLAEDAPGGDGEAPTPADVADDEFVPAPVPGERYLLRLPFFRAFPPPQLPELLAACRSLLVPARRVLLREGADPDVAYITLNGAVEEALGRGGRRIRVRLAGPGRAVGYVGLVDGRPSSVTVATRERALLLVVPRAAFTELFEGVTALSYAFVDAVERDLVAALRQAERPQARLAASRPRA